MLDTAMLLIKVREQYIGWQSVLRIGGTGFRPSKVWDTTARVPPRKPYCAKSLPTSKSPRAALL
jgi:hypothetical protein